MKFDLNDLMKQINNEFKAAKVKWLLEDGTRHSDLIVFDEKLGFYVWYDDYEIYRNVPILYCKEILSITNYEGMLK